MNSYAIRQSFLDFFEKNGHKIIKSSSLMPDAPNLLFTNAGMNRFVPIFLGNELPSRPRIANSQKCIRAGGKHNDLDDVGFDTYHHTFFEMLGNWSFGDYFKKEAIELSWELLTKVWKFPKHRLYATVYSPLPGEPSVFDSEAHNIWEEIFRREKMDPAIHIINGSRRDNFWMMGDTGPCGPCSEIHMDLSPAGSTKGTLVNGGDPMCMEIWNLVFIQFNAAADGNFEPLRNKHVDTGMGLERIAGIFAGTKNFSDFSNAPSNYTSDLFSDIFSALETMGNAKYCGTISQSKINMLPQQRTDFWFRAIADHIRTLTFAIADGIFPSNENRGYVLRRILRRAVMFGKLLHLPHGFFTKLSSIVIKKMGNVFPELEEQKITVEKILSGEESAFSKTIDRGVSLFNEICERSKGKISGNDAFILYDTYGFPLDLTQLMAAERNIFVDTAGFEEAMEKQKKLARSAQKKSNIEISSDCSQKTEFVGYNPKQIENVEATLISTIVGDKNFLIFDKTPFYAESGGQVGDEGTAKIGTKILHIVDVQRDNNGCYLHEIKEQISDINKKNKVLLSVNTATRLDITRNHSATHILHSALRAVLGNHIKQAGSLVEHNRLRFDFNASSAPTKEELRQIENFVMQKILSCESAKIYETDIDKIPEGCIANFGEKYGEIVRVVEFGEFSKVLCGGCHVANTSEICSFKITSISSVAAGIRRIEAVTGQAAADLFFKNCDLIDQQCQYFSCQREEISEKINSLVARNKQLEENAKSTRMTFLQNISKQLVQSDLKQIDGLLHINQEVEGLDPEELRTVALSAAQQMGEGVIIITSRKGERCSIVACCSKLAVKAGHHAGSIVKELVSKNAGSGGGKPEFAMGGYPLKKI